MIYLLAGMAGVAIGLGVIAVMHGAHRLCPYYGPGGLTGIVVGVALIIKKRRERGRVVKC